jgi:hypothetical protein
MLTDPVTVGWLLVGLGNQRSFGPARTPESVMEVVWDLVVFLALVAVGLVGLNLLARRH